ncbi:MAG: hypothetical protein PVF79_14110 [Desulfobacterales bacterium]|jgi:hypothetical protein
MPPIYFPYTYISQQTAVGLANYFRQITIYQASARQVPVDMQKLVDDGFLVIRAPIAADQKKLDDVLKNFQNWAAIHSHRQELKAAILQSGMDPIPFFDDSAVSQIVADIKNDLHQKTGPEMPDAFFHARLFLEFAQEFDRQSQDTRNNLRAYEKKARYLFKDIKGKSEDQVYNTPAGFKIMTDDPGEYMVFRRLDAWTHLFQADAAPCGVFISSNRTIVEHMIGKMSTAEKIYQTDTIPDSTGGTKDFRAWRDDLLANMVRLAKIKWPTSTDGFASAGVSKMVDCKTALSVYLLPDIPPHMYFARAISKNFSQPDGRHHKANVRNTLICLVDPL